MKYVAVIHKWFVHSKGFDVIELNSEESQDAHKEALSISYDLNQNFLKTDFTVIEIDDENNITNKLNKIPRWIRKIFNAL